VPGEGESSLAGNSNIYDRKNKPVEEFENEQWMYDLAFLTDISAHLNELNLKLQKLFSRL